MASSNFQLPNGCSEILQEIHQNNSQEEFFKFLDRSPPLLMELFETACRNPQWVHTHNDSFAIIEAQISKLQTREPHNSELLNRISSIRNIKNTLWNTTSASPQIPLMQSSSSRSSSSGSLPGLTLQELKDIGKRFFIEDGSSLINFSPYYMQIVELIAHNKRKCSSNTICNELDLAAITSDILRPNSAETLKTMQEGRFIVFVGVEGDNSEIQFYLRSGDKKSPGTPLVIQLLCHLLFSTFLEEKNGNFKDSFFAKELIASVSAIQEHLIVKVIKNGILEDRSITTSEVIQSIAVTVAKTILLGTISQHLAPFYKGVYFKFVLQKNHWIERAINFTTEVLDWTRQEKFKSFLREDLLKVKTLNISTRSFEKIRIYNNKLRFSRAGKDLLSIADGDVFIDAIHYYAYNISHFDDREKVTDILQNINDGQSIKLIETKHPQQNCSYYMHLFKKDPPPNLQNLVKEINFTSAIVIDPDMEYEEAELCLNGPTEQVLSKQPNLNEIKGGTPLHEAAQKGLLEKVKELLDNGADYHAMDAINRTPLHWAARNGHLDSVKLLLDKGARVDLITSKQWSALHMAAEHGHLEVVRELLANHADPNTLNSNGRTSLHMAAQNGYLETVELLVANQAEVNAINEDGWSPIHVAAGNGHRDVVEFLLEKQAKLVPDFGGNTPLHLAAYFGKLETVKLLIKKQANLCATNRNGKTPRDMALQRGHFNVANLLLGKQANIYEHIPPHFPPVDGNQNLVNPPLENEARVSFFFNEGIPLLLYPLTATEKKAIKLLNRQIQDYYGVIIPHELCALLKRQQGKWGIDFSTFSDESCKALLKPYRHFLLSCSSSPQEREANLKAILMMFHFFRFFSSAMIDGEETDPTTIYESGGPIDDALANACIDRLLRRNLRSNSIKGSGLLEFNANEVQQSFLTLKLAELGLFCEYCDEFKVIPPQVLPCFLLAPDADHVRIQVMEAYFDERGELEALGEDVGGKASQFLQTVIGDIRLVQDSDQGTYALLTLDQLKKLQEHVDRASNSSRLPAALMIQRLNPVIPNEERADDPVVPASATSSSVVKPGEGQEESLWPRRKKILDTHKKRKRSSPSVEEILSERSPLAPRGTEKRRKLDFRNSFQPLEDSDLQQEMEIDIPPVSVRSSGPLPIISAQMMPQQLPIPAEKIKPQNFWKILNSQSIFSVHAKVRREVLKQATLLEIQPLAYPILHPLSELPLSAPCLPWCRILKPYQIEAVAELLRYRSKGLSKLLSLEMGLGKTFIFSEYIAQIIAESSDKRVHIVAVPKSLLGQTRSEISKLLAEASVTAWQVMGYRNFADQPIYMNLLQNSIDFSDCSIEEFGRFLRIIAQLPHKAEDIEQMARFGFKVLTSGEGLQNKASVLLEAHFRELEVLFQGDQQGEEKFKKDLSSLCQYVNQRFFRISDTLSYEEVVQFVKQFKGSRQDIFNLYRFCGYLLDLSPARHHNLAAYGRLSKDALNRIRYLGFSSNSSSIIIADDLSEIKKINSAFTSQFNPMIAITTLESLTKHSASFIKLPIGSLVIDEASRVHTERSMRSEGLRNSIQALSHSMQKGMNSILLVTGTPFENNIQELWTLFEMSNGENGFLRDTLDSLAGTLFKEVKKKLTDLDNPDDSRESVLLKSFAHFLHLGNLVQSLVHRLKRSDPKILRDWKGRFPEVRYHNIQYFLDPSKISALNALSKGFSDFQKIKNYLIHPDLEGKSLSNQKQQNWPFLDILSESHPSTMEEKKTWINKSPSLQGILGSKWFNSAMSKREKVVIVVDNYALSAAYKRAVELLFAEKQVAVFEYGGELDSGERDDVISSFKGSSKERPAVLLLMIKAGGVGLNIPEADRLFLATICWNPGVEDQVIARIVRANQMGTKKIGRLIFPGAYFSKHPQVVQTVKRNWEAFLWNKEGSLRMRLQLWMEVLKEEVFREYLNSYSTVDSTVEKAEEQKNRVSAYLEEWMASLSDEILADAVKRAAPVSSSRQTQRSSQQMPHSSGVPTASSSSSSQNATRTSGTTIRPLPLPLPLPKKPPTPASLQTSHALPIAHGGSSSSSSSSSQNTMRTSGTTILPLPLLPPAQKLLVPRNLQNHNALEGPSDSEA